MGTKTMGTMLVLMGMMGAASTAEAQNQYRARRPTVAVAGPSARACAMPRGRGARGRGRPCAVPVRRTTAWGYFGVSGAWRPVAWGSAWAPRRFVSRRAHLSPGHLREVLGRRDFKRIRRHARDLGIRGAITGAWTLQRHGVAELEIRADRFLVARLIDRDRDGWTDLTLVRQYW